MNRPSEDYKESLIEQLESCTFDDLLSIPGPSGIDGCALIVCKGTHSFVFMNSLVPPSIRKNLELCMLSHGKASQPLA